MKQLTNYNRKSIWSKMPGSYLLKSLRVLCVMVVLLGASMFSWHNVSAQEASPGNIFTFCDSPTFYAGLHCQIGDKDYAGWYDKSIPPSLPPIARLRIVNTVGNPNRKGRLTIYSQWLYCKDVDWIGHGYIQINNQKFPTCYADRNTNTNAEYLYTSSMVRIITDVQVKYGDSVTLKIFGSIYDHIHDDCRSEKFGWCEFPGISSGWVYAYSRTGAAREGTLAKFYNKYNTYKNRRIYDFLTIKFSDMDLDVTAPDYYDYDDFRMTFGITPN